MSLFSKKIDPTFLNETDYMEEVKSQLKSLEPSLNAAGKKLLKRDIEMIEYGVIGEKNIEFELLNSHIPMYILRNLYFEHEGLTAQIDFIIFTQKIMVLIECKNLYGNITVQRNGDFVREMKFNKSVVKEGIYSPVTQISRHFQFLKKMRSDKSTTFISRYLTNQNFDKYAHSVVVLANPKTVLNINSAPKAIKSKIIRADQLRETIRKLHNNSKEQAISFKQTLDWANTYLQFNQQKPNTFLNKYESYKINNDFRTVEVIKEENNEDLIGRLKEYRLRRHKEKNVPAYYIFNDKQLEDIVALRPSNAEVLKNSNILNKAQERLYTNEIIDIINNE